MRTIFYPFKEEEVITKKKTFSSQRYSIEKKLAILEMINGLEKREHSLIESVSTFAGTFSELRVKYISRIDTIRRGINRLIDCYEKINIIH